MTRKIGRHTDEYLLRKMWAEEDELTIGDVVGIVLATLGWVMLALVLLWAVGVIIGEVLRGGWSIVGTVVDGFGLDGVTWPPFCA